jgi:arsenate reductase (thioredoxin)
VEVMREIGIDISNEVPTHLRRAIHQEWDDVITMCPRSAVVRPALRGPAVYTHWSFFDPELAQGTTEEQLEVCRRVRDEIQTTVSRYSKNLLRFAGSNLSASGGTG